MPFVRRKSVKGIGYFYLVESYRADGKMHQRVLAYLGRHETVKAAYNHWQEQAKTGNDAADRKHARMMIQKLKPYL